MGRRVSPTLIGAFLVGAIAIVVITIIALGSGRLFRKTQQYVMYFSGSVNGLLVGAAVKMEGVPVGTVKEIQLGFNPHGEPVEEIPAKVKIAVIVELDEKRMRTRGVRNTDLADPEHIKRAVQHGLRGVLAMESLLTGILYVDLEMLPDTPANFVQQQNEEYVEIPTIPTALEQAQVTVTQILEHLQRADFDKALSDLSATLEALKKFTTSQQLQDAVANLAEASAELAATASSVRRLANNMNAQTGPLAQSLRQTADKANATLAQAQATLANLQATFDPQAPLAYQLNQTLIEVSRSARSMRELTDYLERNPSSIVRGK
ncbi:MAG: MlaD family protein [Candidatus Binatus sp.]